MMIQEIQETFLHFIHASNYSHWQYCNCSQLFNWVRQVTAVRPKESGKRKCNKTAEQIKDHCFDKHNNKTKKRDKMH